MTKWRTPKGWSAHDKNQTVKFSREGYADIFLRIIPLPDRIELRPALYPVLEKQLAQSFSIAEEGEFQRFQPRNGIGSLCSGTEVSAGKPEETMLAILGFPDLFAILGYGRSEEKKSAAAAAMEVMSSLDSAADGRVIDKDFGIGLDRKALLAVPGPVHPGPRIFLSHNSEDKPMVRQVAACLKAAGIFYWLDELELKPGVPLVRNLEKALKSMTHCIMCLGPSGFGRWQDWEYDIAVAQEVEGAAKLLPLQLEGGPPPGEWRLAMKRLLGKAVPWTCEDIVGFAKS